MATVSFSITTLHGPHFYEAALLEVDSKLLPQRIAEAQKVIAERNAILQSKGEYNSEIEALRNAHILLDDLNRIYCAAPRAS